MPAPQKGPPLRRIERVKAQVPAQCVIRKAIAAMHGRQRLVLALYYFEELGPSAIASALETPLDEIEGLLHRGRAEVSRALTPRGRRAGGSDAHAS